MAPTLKNHFELKSPLKQYFTDIVTKSILSLEIFLHVARECTCLSCGESTVCLLVCLSGEDCQRVDNICVSLLLICESEPLDKQHSAQPRLFN